jgi:eukaryotic-like serine/threonine-protein kinase
MATVHLGRLLGPAGFSKIVAIKRLHAAIADDPEFLSALVHEAQLASAISHPNVVSSLDVVVENDEVLLIMEYVHGETLAQLTRLALKRDPEPALGIIQRILCDALDGLHAAHTASVGGQPLNIVHRDVSPQNIMVAENGVARVLDFGIAKAESKSDRTRPGIVKGKFAYLSPEQIRCLPADARTDVFSAGVVLWESLTGSRLFSSSNLKKTSENVLSAPIPPPSSRNPSISARLDRVVLKALNRQRTQRYQSAAEFADALRAVGGEATRAEVSAWVSITAAEVLARRQDELRELQAIDAEDADMRPITLSAPAWDDKTRVDGPQSERSSAHLRSELSGASIISGGTTRSLTPDVSVPRRSRHLAGVGLALLAGLLGVIAHASLRRHFPTVAAASARSVTSSSESRLPAGAVALTATPAAVAFASATAPIPIVQLAELAELPEAPLVAPLRSAASGAKLRTSVRAARRERTPVPSVNCDPPYRIDAAGVRRVRFECL